MGKLFFQWRKNNWTYFLCRTFWPNNSLLARDKHPKYPQRICRGARNTLRSWLENLLVGKLGKIVCFRLIVELQQQGGRWQLDSITAFSN